MIVIETIQDSKKRIVLLTNETKNNVIFFDKRGKVLKTWGHEFPERMDRVYSEKEKISSFFITDTERHQFYKTSIDGKHDSDMGLPCGKTEKYTEAKQFVPSEAEIDDKMERCMLQMDMARSTSFTMMHKERSRIFLVVVGDKESNLDNAHGICIDYCRSSDD